MGRSSPIILRAKKIPFTALDISPEQVALVKRFGSEAFYGDASRHEILERPPAPDTRAFVLAIDDVEASLKTAEVVRHHYRDVPISPRPQPQSCPPAARPWHQEHPA